MSKEKNAFDNILIVMILAHHHKKPKNKGLDKLPFFFTIRTCEHFSPPFFLLRQIGDLSGGARDYSQTPPIFTQKRTEIDYSTWTLNLYLGKERKKRALIRLCRIELETLNERSRAALLLWWWYTLGSNFTMANIQPRSKWYILIISRPYWRRIYRVVWTTRIEHFAFFEKIILR